MPRSIVAGRKDHMSSEQPSRSELATGCLVLVVIGALLLWLLSSCLGGDDESGGSAKKRARDETVLIQADDPVCWTFEAYDERIDAGRQDDDDDEDVDYSKAADIEEKTTVVEEGCGSATIVLPARNTYGAVYLDLDDDEELHPARDIALLLWLTRETKPRGGMLAKPHHGDQYILYASDPETTHRGSDGYNEEVADRAFGNVYGMNFHGEERDAVRRAGFEPDTAGDIFLRAADRLMHTTSDVGGFEDGLAALKRTAFAASLIQGIGRREVTPGSSEFDPSSWQAVARAIESLASGRSGEEWASAVRPLRSYVADLWLAERREDLEYTYDGGAFRGAIRQSAILDRLDPARRSSWSKLRKRWSIRAAAQDAEAARDAASWDGSGGGGGGDFDVPGFLCPTRFC